MLSVFLIIQKQILAYRQEILISGKSIQHLKQLRIHIVAFKSFNGTHGQASHNERLEKNTFDNYI